MERQGASKGRRITLKINDRLPDFLLPSMGGAIFSSRDLGHGHLRAICFWGCWDERSRVFLGELQSWYHAARPSSVDVVSVALDVQGHSRSMRWIRETGVEFTTLIDGPALSCRLFGLVDVPVVVIADAGNRIIEIDEDPGDATLRRIVRLAEDPPAPAAPGGSTLPAVDQRYEIETQACTNFLGRRRHADAIDRLRNASALMPGCLVLSRQLSDLERTISGLPK